MNKLMIIGNLTKDPELRVTQDGRDVCNFTVAVNRQGKANRDAKGNEVADFFRVSAWNEKGKVCKQFLTKGKKVAVIGSVSVNTYTAQDGTVKANLEVLASEVEFISPKSDSVDKQTGYTKVDMPENVFPPEKPAEVQTEMDELPF